LPRFPKQGDREPWVNPQDYQRDKSMIRKGALEDGVLAFAKAAPVRAAPRPMLHAAE
jgi:hypothetical protein